MGYRSLVGICFTRDKNTAPSVPELLALARVKGIIKDDGLGKYWSAKDYGWDNDKFMFYVEDVKWYESFEDVVLMETLFAFVKELSEENEDWYSGMFLRIGEEDSDIEQNVFGHNPYDHMCLSRSISFDDSLLGNQKEKELTQQTQV